MSRPRGRAQLRAVPDPPERVDPPPVGGRVPPHDLDAEAAVLSAILLDAGALSKVLDVLRPEHFYSDANARIFQAAQQLVAASTPVDLVNVGSWLREREWLREAGGSAYLAQIADATPAVGHVLSHARTVLDRWRLRQLIATCQRVAAEGYGDVGDVQAFVDGAHEAVGDLARVARASAGPVRLAKAFEETWRRVESAQPGKITGYSTGLATVDAVTAGLHGSEVLLLKAKRKTGKSVLCGQFAATIAANPVRRTVGPRECRACEDAGEKPCADHEWQWLGSLIFALEGKVEDWSTRLACAHARVDANKVRKGEAGFDELRLLAAAGKHLAPLAIDIDDRKDLTLARLRARVYAAQQRFREEGVELANVVLDNIQLWPALDDRRDRRVVLDEAMQGIMALAAEKPLARVSWIVVSQVNSEGTARDASALEAHADTIATLWCESEDKAEADGACAARLTVEAQRRGPQNKHAPFWYYPKWTLFWGG